MKKIILYILRLLTLPFAALYGLLIGLRNKMYDTKLMSSTKFSLPVICVGNLSVGGTGKSPHVDYLIQLLQQQYQVATLSRGYKRITKGFILASDIDSAKTIGDEPMQFKLKHPNISVAVAEDRLMAIPTLLHQNPEVQVVLLDDAFQHRTVTPSLNILLTDYSHRYTNDFILPFGRLRESKKAAKRADIIIITKCNPTLSIQEKEKIIAEIYPLPYQKIFFTAIAYQAAYDLFTKEEITMQHKNVLLVCGIANPTSIVTYVKTSANAIYPLLYKDHYYFNEDDINEMITALNNIAGENKLLLTTEKDATRLQLFQKIFLQHNIQVGVLPIETSFLFGEQATFNTIIFQHLLEYYPPEIYYENYGQKTEPA